MDELINKYCNYKYSSISINNIDGEYKYEINFSDEKLLKPKNIDLYKKLDDQMLLYKIVSDFIDENEITETNIKESNDEAIYAVLTEKNKSLEFMYIPHNDISMFIYGLISKIEDKKCNDFEEKFKKLIKKDIFSFEIISDLNDSKLEYIGNLNKKITLKTKIYEHNKTVVISKREKEMLNNILSMYIDKYKDNFTDYEYFYDDIDLNRLEIRSEPYGNLDINHKKLIEDLRENQIIENLNIKRR